MFALLNCSIKIEKWYVTQREAIRQRFRERKIWSQHASRTIRSMIPWHFHDSYEYTTRDVMGISGHTCFPIAKPARIKNIWWGIDETDLVAAIIYIDSFELIFSREFRVRAVRRALRAGNSRKRHVTNHERLRITRAMTSRQKNLRRRPSLLTLICSTAVTRYLSFATIHLF